MNDESLPKNRHLISIARNASIGMIGQVFFFFVRFLIAILITRTLGAKDYGIFLLGFNIITGIRIVALLGMRQAVVRFVAKYRATEDIPKVKGSVNFSLLLTTIFSLFLSIPIFIFADQISITIFHEPRLPSVLKIMLIGLPVSTCLLIILSALEGVRRVKHSVFIEKIALPLLRLILISVSFLIGFRILGLAWVWTVASIAGLIMAWFFWMKIYRGIKHVKAKFNVKEIFSFSIPIMLSGIFNKESRAVLILLIGVFYSSSEVGIYGVAERIIPFLLIPFVAYNTIFSPITAGLHAKSKTEELESVYKTGTKWVVVFTIPLFAFVYYFVDQIILIFGAGFGRSSDIMLVLLIGQFVNVATGSSGQLLAMTGKPLYNLFNSFLLFTTTIVLTIGMMKVFGLIGAALGYSIAIIIVNLVMIWEVWHLYKIHSFSLGYFKPVFSSLISFLLVSIMRHYININPSIYSNILWFVTFMCGYSILLKLFRFSKEDHLVVSVFKDKFTNLIEQLLGIISWKSTKKGSL
jgi:O-antigen/teichoic acid export membrane protein